MCRPEESAFPSIAFNAFSLRHLTPRQNFFDRCERVFFPLRYF
jgi:hypothetical protein